MVMKNYKWVVNFSCSKLLKEWWWRPTSEFVNFSCSELLIYPYLAWNDVLIPIYVLNELLQANIRIRTITRICGDRWSIFAQVILTLLILSCAAQYVLCSHCCYNCHQTSWMDLASFGPYAMHFWKIMFFRWWDFSFGTLFKVDCYWKNNISEDCVFSDTTIVCHELICSSDGASFRNFLENWAMRLSFQVTNVSGFISVMNGTFLW